MIKKLRVTVEGKAYDVSVEVLDEGASTSPSVRPASSASASASRSDQAPAATAPGPAPASDSPGDVPSPLAGKVVSIDCKVGDAVKEGDRIITLEAMKMNTLVTAPVAGTIKAVHVGVGDGVEEGQSLLTIA